MLKRLFAPGPFKTFYVVFAYIIIFILWWAYLLYEKNESAYKEKVELNQIYFKQLHPVEAYSSTPEYQQIHSKYVRQKIMIVAEGIVFIFLLLFGLLRVRRVFVREMALVSQQQNFLLSVTHELKSPLSTIKLSLQTLNMRKQLDQEKYSKLLSNSLVDLERLETLVDNILFAAKIEREDPGFSNAEIDASAIVTAAVERFSQGKKAVQIVEDVPGGVRLRADAIGFTSVVNNLIENAIKYSEPGSEVLVQLINEDGKVQFKVTDKGTGIPAEEKEKVFEKFYRVGDENTRKTKGTGLGLYIVKRFVEIYEGEIEVTDNQPKGTIFCLSFPA